MKLFYLFAISTSVIVAVFLLSATAAGQEKTKSAKTAKAEKADKTPPDLLTAKGPATTISEELSQMIQFKPFDAGLVPEILVKNDDKAYELMQKIEEKIGWGNGGSSWGGATWSFSASSEKLGLQFTREKADSKYLTRLIMTEREKPFRRFHLSMGDEKKFQLVIEGEPNVNYLFRISQEADGSIVVQEINGTEVFSAVQANFDEFCRSYPEFAESRIGPLFARFGIGKLISPYSSAVKEQVLFSIVPLSEEDLHSFSVSLQNLDSTSYVVREQESEKLSNEYNSLRDVMMRIATDRRFSPEVRDRVAEVINKKEKGTVSDIVRFVSTNKLDYQTEFLVWLLENETRPEYREKIIVRICEVEKLKTGKEDEAFANWLKEFRSKQKERNKVENGSRIAVSEIVDSFEALKKVKKGLGQLLALKTKENSITLDETHWAEPFGGKTIQEHSADILKEMQARGLPRSWYNAGGDYSASSAGYEQVLFERLSEEFTAEDKKSYEHMHSHSSFQEYENSGKDRHFVSESLRGDLIVDGQTSKSRRPRNGNESVHRPQFMIRFQEQGEAANEFVYSVERNNSIQIRFSNHVHSVFIRLNIQPDDSVIIQDVRANHIFVKEAASFDALIKDNSDYFSNEFFPLISAIGVELNKEEFQFTPLQSDRPNEK
jgi:hypothetical protein